MRRALIILLIAGILAASVILAGCGENEAENDSPRGKVAVSEDNGGNGDSGEQDGEGGDGDDMQEDDKEEEGDDGDADSGDDNQVQNEVENDQARSGDDQIQNEDGDTQDHSEESDTSLDVSEDQPSEEELGVPIYPGAVYEEGSGGVVSGKSGERDVFSAAASFTTTDSFQKVLDWYTERLGEPTYEGTGGYEGANWLKGRQNDMVTVEIDIEDGVVYISITHVKGALKTAYLNRRPARGRAFSTSMAPETTR